MSEDLILIERPLAGCTLITLNRPQAKNALSRALRRELTTAIDRLAGDPAARVLILTGAGDAFCAGMDLKELAAAASSEALAADDPALDPVAALKRFPGALIAAINGVAVTGGFELALTCDVLLASRQARFADTHARVGLLPTWGLSQRLSRAIGIYRAKELSLTGNFVSAERAEAWGLVNRVVEPAQLLPEALELAAEMLSALPQMLVSYKKLIDDGYARELRDGLELEVERGTAAMRMADPAELELRRLEVRSRGRQQVSGAQR